MPDFTYVARTQTGEVCRGRLTATDRPDAVRALLGRSLCPVEVAPVAEAKVWGKRVPGRRLAAMYVQLADLLQSGIPLLHALSVLRDQKHHAALSQVLANVRDRVADGESLADAMQAHPAVFSNLAVSIVRAGQEGGFLEEALQRIAVFTDEREDLKSRLMGAVAYPAFLMVASAVVLVCLLVFFVPRFTPIFERLRERGELPVPTTVLLGVSHFLNDRLPVVALVVLGVAWAVWRYCTGPAGGPRLSGWLLKIHLVGPIVRSFAIARFCRMFGTLLQNGVAILTSLQIAKDATGNALLSRAIGRAAENLSAGRSLTGPLEASGQFPQEILEMISVGEQTNKLEEILRTAAGNLERYANRRLDLLMRLLEPVLLLAMAAVILLMLLALLLPVFQSASSLA